MNRIGSIAVGALYAVLMKRQPDFAPRSHCRAIGIRAVFHRAEAYNSPTLP